MSQQKMDAGKYPFLACTKLPIVHHKDVQRRLFNSFLDPHRPSSGRDSAENPLFCARRIASLVLSNTFESLVINVPSISKKMAFIMVLPHFKIDRFGSDLILRNPNLNAFQLHSIIGIPTGLLLKITPTSFVSLATCGFFSQYF